MAFCRTCTLRIPSPQNLPCMCPTSPNASVDALCRDGAGIACLGKASKLGAPGDISLFKHLTKLYQLYSSMLGVP